MKKNLILNILLAVCVAVFLVSGFFLVRYFLESRENTRHFETLAGLVEQPSESVPQDSVPSVPGHSADAPAFLEVPGPDGMVSVLTEYAQLYTRNPDLVGWMKIDGTKLNYPVMQTPDRKDYYLHRNFDREHSAHGCFYASEVCDVSRPSDNVTIYGHNMRDGSMMAVLHRYRKESFFREHPIIHFDTLFQHRDYEIMAVFRTSASKGKGFAYHRFVDAETPAEFDEFVETCRELSFYDTGVTAHYGDKLITLSTCEYTLENGRLVVVARQIV